MLILSQDQRTMVLFNNVTILGGYDGHTNIVQDKPDGTQYDLGKYNTAEEGAQVMIDIRNAILRGDKIYRMPEAKPLFVIREREEI